MLFCKCARKGIILKKALQNMLLLNSTKYQENESIKKESMLLLVLPN